MGKFIDITGCRFGRLTTIERAGTTKKGEALWECKCDCGNKTVVQGSALRSGATKSCGCLHREILIQKNKDRQTHGKKHTRLYRIWDKMKRRCLNPKDKDYPNYAARGITVCNEWLHFEPFYEWAIAHGYRDDLSIDRIDNDKGCRGYSPENCRWVSMKAQANNRRSNRRITYNSETHTLAEWSEITGISENAIRFRLKNGWSVEQALTTANEKQTEDK